MYPLIHLFKHTSIDRCKPKINISILLSTHSFNYPFIHLSIHPFIPSFIHIPIHLQIHHPIYSFIQTLLYLLVQLFNPKAEHLGCPQSFRYLGAPLFFSLWLLSPMVALYQLIYPSQCRQCSLSSWHSHPPLIAPHFY